MNLARLYRRQAVAHATGLLSSRHRCFPYEEPGTIQLGYLCCRNNRKYISPEVNTYVRHFRKEKRVCKKQGWNAVYFTGEIIRKPCWKDITQICLPRLQFWIFGKMWSHLFVVITLRSTPIQRESIC